MTAEQQTCLLELARQTISYYAAKGEAQPLPYPDDPFFLEHRAVFVTLTEGKELRGCIGQMHATQPLYEAVANMAIAAANRDPRFKPVRRAEIPFLRIEISVLSPMQRIDDWQKINLKTDGVWIRQGLLDGVFLPQVAQETGWDRETLLRHLCRDKAGLPEDAYTDPDTEIYVFQVENFREEKQTKTLEPE